MGWRFHRTVKVIPGVRLNLGKKSASVRVGGRGFGVTGSTTGRTTVSAGMPGTGISYSESFGGESWPTDSSRPAGRPRRAVESDLPPHTASLPPVAPAPGRGQTSGGRRPGWRWLVLVAAVLAMAVGFVWGGFAALLVGGLGVFLWGLIRWRRLGWPVVAAGVALMVGGIDAATAGPVAPVTPALMPAQLVASPVASATPVPAETVTVTATPAPAPTITVSATPTPGPTITVTATPRPAPTVTVTATAKATSAGGSATKKKSDTSGTKKKSTGSGTKKKSSASKQTSVTYANCAAVRAAGAAPLYQGSPGYSRKLDRNNNGVACETR